MIRKATLTDLYPIKDLLMEHKDELGYGHVSVDELSGMRAVSQMMNSQRGLVLVAYKGEDLIAAIAVFVQAYWLNPSEYFVTDMFFLSLDPFASSGMIDRVEQWAWNLKIKVIDVSLGISSGSNIERTGQFYVKKGYRAIGGTYMKVNPNLNPVLPELEVPSVKSN